jgi:hypothetical protein
MKIKGKDNPSEEPVTRNTNKKIYTKDKFYRQSDNYPIEE